MIKILIADGHQVVASGIAKILGDIENFEVIGQARTGDEAFRVFERDFPDVLCMDIDLPGPISGLEIIRRLHQRSPRTHVLILTNLVDEAIIRDALREGVISYLLKDSSIEELIEAIRATHQGTPTFSPEVTRMFIREVIAPSDYHLTSREREVLELLARGLSNHEIADRLTVSLSTVQFHVSNILSKLGLHNRIEAATFAVRHKLAD